jgi:hypothetical protein
MPHITPGYNGWTHEAPKVLKAINAKAQATNRAAEIEENSKQRERAELEYYEDNNCFPRPMGYFGTETDAHFYER